MIPAQKTRNLARGQVVLAILEIFTVWFVLTEGASFPLGRVPQNERLELIT